MPFEVVRNDITNMQVDAIVNTADPRPVIGFGTDAQIHRKAGPELLLARQQLGDIACGSAVITPAYALPASYVIHTVGPVWDDGNRREEALLRSCYDNALRLALEYNCRSIAFPLISTGSYGFPKDKGLQIAISAFSAFLTEHEMRIYLVVFDHASFKLSEKLFQGVTSYIDEHYVAACECAVRDAPKERRTRKNIPSFGEMKASRCDSVEEMLPCASIPTPKIRSLEDMLKQEDAGFTETLLKLIDRKGRKDSEIYKRAGLTKQHFSKIRNNLNYRPTKQTAIALALALELDLDDAKDLIGRAGYALSNSSKFDLIIRYFIENRNYNVVEINCVLFEYDQSLLGS